MEKKARVAKRVTENPHTLNEVCDYMMAKYGFSKVLKDMYRYYGVTEEDIKAKSKRYEELLCRLASK